MSKDLIVGILSNLVGGLILAALLEAFKWELKRVKGDLSAVRSRLGLWFDMNLKRILIVGILVNLSGLTWLLIKFPTVHLWTVLVIVVSVALMGFQVGVFLLIRTIEGIFKAILNAVTKKPDQLKLAQKPETLPKK